MTHATLLAVLDVLLPGDEGEPPLPSASAAGLDPAALARLAAPVLDALGDHDGFLTASAAVRVARLRAIEQARPDAFKALLSEALARYYEAPPVLAALGWHTAPPQPRGHDVAPTDAVTLRLLERVKQRGRLWRA
jgi:hypothetical protein